MFNVKEQQFIKVFWIILSSFLFCLLFWRLENSLHAFQVVYLFSLKQDIFVHIFVWLGLIILLISLVKVFIKYVSLHKLRRQPSWFFYFTQGFLWGSVSYIFIQFISLTSYIQINNSFLLRFFYENWLLIGLFIFIFLAFKFVKTKKVPFFENFASESVGLGDKDEFDFGISAKNVTLGVEEDKNYLSVFTLYGDMGFGKSSYSRMIIEGLDREKNLYTYISLTETNEAKDFSKLFAERWKNTISERYIKMDMIDYLPLISTILREGDYGFWSGILNALEKFNFGLLKTLSKTKDVNFQKESIFTSKNVGGIFGDITEFKENRWVIVIDEIERAQFDEIYRVVEIIERFKNEGRTGLPLKLTFILCISKSDLALFLSTFKNSDSKAYQLQGFFDDGKSIIQPIFLPPISFDVIEKHVAKKTSELIKEENIEHNLDSINPNTIANPTFNFINNPEESLNYITGLISQKSPRQINRIFSAFVFYSNTFKNFAGIPLKNSVRFSDILAMEYIKINHPPLIEFFKRTIGYLVISHEKNNISNWYIKNQLKEKNLDILGWIEMVLDVKLSQKEKDEFPELIGLVCYTYFDFVQNREDSAYTKLQYEGTLSYPENMNDYLTIVAENTKTTFRIYNKIYRNHLKSNQEIKLLSIPDLVGYARFLSNLKNNEIDLYIDVYKKLKEVLVSGEVKINKGDTGQTQYDEVIYRFIYCAVDILERESIDSELPIRNIEIVFDSIKEVLTSKKVTIGGKIIIINSYVNTERGQGSLIHNSLNSVFQKLNKYYKNELVNIIRGVFDDFNQKYVIEKKVIYEEEENYFYCMYQNWSGESGNKIERKKLRTIAFNCLYKNPNIIRIYWDRFPDPSGYRNFNEMINDYRRSVNEDFQTNNLYMPLRNLISATKLSKITDPDILKKMEIWSRDEFINHEKYIKMSELSSKTDTLKSFLLRHDILRP